MAAKKQEGASVPAVQNQKTGLPAEMSDMFNEDAGAGLENVGSRDVAIPFLIIFQKGSPQVDETTGEYIERAKPGMIYNTVTGEMYSRDQGVRVIPAGFISVGLVWKPRETGGGLVAQVTAAEYDDLLKTTSKNQKGQDVLPNGNLLVLTAQHYVLHIKPTGEVEQALIAMTSTQLKKSRRWNSLMMNIKLQGKNGLFTPPTFSHVYRLATTPESNEYGSWFGWEIQTEGPITDPMIYQQAKLFHESVQKGLVKTQNMEQAMGGESSSADDKNIPF